MSTNIYITLNSIKYRCGQKSSQMSTNIIQSLSNGNF